MSNPDRNREDQNTNDDDVSPPSITQRLREILIDDDDEDLLLRSSDSGGGDFMQWIQALDMQVVGACRTDERLKPLLKLNISTGAAEDRLLAHLSQHFEPSEVALLARCLCVPLVSVRAGKIKKQATLFSPTSIRGNLCLTLLPTSDMRISFNGDDGSVERLATLSTETQCTTVEIEEISADNSGRSFLIKTADGVISYFWCCEKSKLLGEELLRKMKDLLSRKLSLAELTGISESRLNYFASELRTYLAGSAVASANVSNLHSAGPPSENSVLEHHSPQSLSSHHQETPSFRYCGTTQELNQDRVTPSSNPACDGSISGNSSSSTKSACEESNNFSYADTSPPASSVNTKPSKSSFIDKHNFPDTNEIYPYAASNILDSFGKSFGFPLSGSNIQIPPSNISHLSPHYCWCPPQYSLGISKQPNSSAESLSLPPLSSLLSSTTPTSLSASKPTLNLADLPPLDFPNLLPDPFMRLPTSGQIPTFTPLMCDPIVHIPVIDICSSGPGYLVSASPAISTVIPPYNPDLIDPLLPKIDPTVENSARETLRMLISSSSQTNPQALRSSEDTQNILVVGSRGLYSGTIDIGFCEKLSRSENMPQSILAFGGSRGLYSGTLDVTGFSEKSCKSGIVNTCASKEDLVDDEKPSSSGPSDFDS